jgi:glycosyltransferase involved in cell wall biosynthesis
MSSLRFAIVTPSFNQAQFLEKTVQSVLNQQGDFEIDYWVQDGGSNDGSFEILKKYQTGTSTTLSDRSNFGFESLKDRGQTHAINMGFQKVSGDIYAYLNSDDFYAENTFSKVAQYFSDHPDVDVVYGQRNYVDEQGRAFATTGSPFSKFFLKEIDFIPQETVFWRKAIWDKVGAHLDENFHFAMDYELWLRFLMAGAKFAYLPVLLGSFRIHAVSKTQNLFKTKGLLEINQLRAQFGKTAVGYQGYFLRVFIYRVRYFWSRKVFWSALMLKLKSRFKSYNSL